MAPKLKIIGFGVNKAIGVARNLSWGHSAGFDKFFLGSNWGATGADGGGVWGGVPPLPSPLEGVWGAPPQKIF